MRKFCIVALLFAAIATTATTPAARAQGKPDVIRLDAALDAIVSSDAKVEKLAGDMGFTEGPVWVRKGGFLIFSDIRSNSINKWDPKDGKVSKYIEHSGFASIEKAKAEENPNTGGNGVAMDPQGRVVICAQGDRAIVRIEKDGSRTVLAKEYNGKRLNRTNDVVVKKDGAVYFTDPPPRDAPESDKPVIAIFRAKDGKVQPAITDNPAPNGLAFSPDEKYLYSNATAKKLIFRHEVLSDGLTANGKTFFEMSGDTAIGGPDGMKVDKKGTLYSTGPGGIWIITPEAKHIGTILTPEQASNVAFGDADGKTLYITARTGVYRIRLKAEGIRP